MTGLLQTCIDTYNYYIHEQGDPRVAHFYLLGSPIGITIIILSYTLFCTKYGPKFMEKRKAFTLEKLMMAYNLSQILMNAAFIYISMSLIWIPMHYKLICQMPGDKPVDEIIAHNVYLFFLCRLCDLFDTVFMILRKKNKQITFLHIYHHVMVASLCWIHTKYLPGGHVIVFGTLNSFVHAIMYTYYFITAVFPEQKKLIWWKRHITELQIFQFLVIAAQNIIALFSPTCEYPTVLILIYLSQTIFMLYLFSKFYYKAYLVPSEKKNK